MPTSLFVCMHVYIVCFSFQNGQITSVKDKPKPSKKASAAPKVDTDKLTVTLFLNTVKLHVFERSIPIGKKVLEELFLIKPHSLVTNHLTFG